VIQRRRCNAGRLRGTRTPGVAAGLTLLPPAPNPFAEVAELAFETPDPGRVTLEIFDVAGRRVARLRHDGGQSTVGKLVKAK